MIAIKFLKIGTAVLLTVCILVFTWIYPFKLPNENDFLLEVEFPTNISAGEAVKFSCRLKNNTHKLLKTEHAAHIISYEFNGEKENMIQTAIEDYFLPYQSEERIISHIFKEQGEYAVTVFAEFDILKGKEKRSVLLEKEISVAVGA